MKNILSFAPRTKIKGKDIKEWVRYHTENETSHSAEARGMIKYLNIDDEKFYIIRRGNYQASERTFQVIGVKE